jgi:signal peptidase I
MAKFSWRRFWQSLLEWTVITVVSVLFATVLRIFVICSFKVPTWSMYPAIEPGDFIMVNKQIPGPRIYPTFPHIAPEGKVITKRYRGIREIERNDVIVFNFPYTDRSIIKFDTEVNYVKRCVAIPGDTFLIQNGIYRIINAPEAVVGDRSNQEKLSFQYRTDSDAIPLQCFPYDTVHYRWNTDNFGPFYIPRAGARIAIDTVNYQLYSRIIAYETDLTVEKKDGAVMLGDSIIGDYTFAMNYYFMAGDYVFDSVDSRFWGLVPEDHIVGKAIIIWKAEDMETKKYRWGRFFKLL